jgi:hypothetical protein
MAETTIDINPPEEKEISLREWFDQEQLNILYKAVESARLRAKNYLKKIRPSFRKQT